MMGSGVHVPQCAQGGQKRTVESILSFYLYVGSGDRTQAIKLVPLVSSPSEQDCLSTLSYATGPLAESGAH